MSWDRPARRLGVALLVLAVVFIAIKLRDVSGVERKEPSAEYMARARALAEAVDVAAQIRATLKDERQADTVAFERVWVKEKALAPDPPFANLESLAYLEDGFLTYWNEADGEHVDRFWRLVAKSGLPFQRRDIVRDVLRRGRISDDIEYQHVTDGLVILRQVGKISKEEADRLSVMLKQFEEHGAKRQ